MNLALVATPAGIKHYEELFSNTSQTLPHVEVVAGNKQISQKAAQLSAEKDFILMHMKVILIRNIFMHQFDFITHFV